MHVPARRLVLLLLACLLLGITARARAQAPDRPAAKKYPSRQEIARKYDKDGDGQLSPAERQALRKDIVEGRLELPPQIRERLRQLRDRQPPRLPEGVTVQHDVEYGRAGQRPLVLDIVRPDKPTADKLPLVVFIHGGGWRGGNKAGGIGRIAPLVAGGNYVGASVGYRLSGEAKWPAQIHDCKAAIRWLRANAQKYGADPQRIAVWGGSAGGHLVSMLGTSGDVEKLEGANGSPDASSRVQCVVDFCGPSNFLARKKVEGGREPSAVTMLLGGRIEDKPELAKEASPITYVSKDDPPFLIVHGTNDGTVPLQQAEMLHAALQKAGTDVTFVKIEGGGHGIGGPEVTQRVNAFLEKQLRGRDVEVSDEPIAAPERPQPKRKPGR